MSAPAETYNPETGEVLDEDAPDTGGWDRERHCATDLRGVDWAGRKLRAAQERIILNGVMFDAEVAPLKAKLLAAAERLDRANAPCLKTAAFMENVIKTFAATPAGRVEVLKGLPSKRKSCLLPSGVTVAYRTRREGYFWNDALKESERKAKLLAWALRVEGEMESPNLTAPGPVQPNLDAIKARLQALADPEQPRFTPPGLKYVEPGEELVIWTDLSMEDGK